MFFHWNGELRVGGAFGEEDLLPASSSGAVTTYNITGVVTVAGTPTASIVVRVYTRADGVLVDSTTTDGSGVYEFNGLDSDADKYFVLAFDPAGGTNYNIGRLDRLTAGL